MSAAPFAVREEGEQSIPQQLSQPPAAAIRIASDPQQFSAKFGGAVPLEPSMSRRRVSIKAACSHLALSFVSFTAHSGLFPSHPPSTVAEVANMLARLSIIALAVLCLAQMALAEMTLVRRSVSSIEKRAAESKSPGVGGTTKGMHQRCMGNVWSNGDGYVRDPQIV